MNELCKGKNKLCKNMDCERYPPDWDFEEDTEDTYQEGQWKKCCLCDGYFDDDGLGDILFVQEEPNNQEAQCDLCGKTKNIVQMKGSGQYLCEAACDESDSESDSENENENNEETNKCENCNIQLDHARDGSTEKNFRCNNCYWEDKEGKNSTNFIKPDYRKNTDENDRYVLCNNCSYETDCWNNNIYCLYKTTNINCIRELIICQYCNDDLREEFEEDGYTCDDWEDSQSDEDINTENAVSSEKNITSDTIFHMMSPDKDSELSE